MYQNRKAPLPKKVAQMRWKPGSVCRLCGQEIKATHFSKDPKEKEYEQKWCIHMCCQRQVTGILDRNTK